MTSSKERAFHDNLKLPVRDFSSVIMYWSEKQLPELAHLPQQERAKVWISFVCARPLARKWLSDGVLAGIIIGATTAGFIFGIISFFDRSPLIPLACGVVGSLVGCTPGYFLFLYNINSGPVRRDLREFLGHPAVTTDPLRAVIAFDSKRNSTSVA
jgi:hypothetical protein